MTDMTPLAEADPSLAVLIAKDAQRQRSKIQLIASENFVSRAMMEAVGSVLANKYSEGYPGAPLLRRLRGDRRNREPRN